MHRLMTTERGTLLFEAVGDLDCKKLDELHIIRDKANFKRQITEFCILRVVSFDVLSSV